MHYPHFLDPKAKTYFSSPHFSSRFALSDVKLFLERIYQLVDADSKDQFVLTSSIEESIVQVFHSIYFDFILQSGKNEFLIGALEDSTTLLKAAQFEEIGCIFETVPVNSFGVITESSIEKMITPKTGALFLSLANLQTGVVQQVEKIAKLCEEKSVLLHLSVDDALGIVPFSFQKLRIPYISLSGPRGLGGVFIRHDLPFRGLIPTGSRFNPLRGGEFDPELIKSFSESIQSLMDESEAASIHLINLKGVFEELLKQGGLVPLFEQSDRLPQISCITAPGVSADLMAMHLGDMGIFPTLGGGHFQKLEYVLSKCGIEIKQSKSALTFRFHFDMTEESIQDAAHRIILKYEELKKLSADLRMS